MRCSFEIAWVGQCKEESIEGSCHCKEHDGLKCCFCGGSSATRTCSDCGGPLCYNCEHEIAPDGTNGGGGIHIRKGTQKFKLWFEQTGEEQLSGEYFMLKRKLATWRRFKEYGTSCDDKIEYYLGEIKNMEFEHPELAEKEE